MPATIEDFGHSSAEFEETVADAEMSDGRSPEERYAMFRSVQRTVAAAWAHLDEGEMRRRLRIAEALEPRPEPWWRNVRPDALPSVPPSAEASK